MEVPSGIEVIDTPTGTMWFDENGILCVVGKKSPPQSLEEAVRSTEDFKKIVKGKKVCLLLDITYSSPSTKEVRDYSASELAKLTTAMALISRSALGKMVVNLFFGLKPPPYPAKMFTDEGEAKAWLMKYVNVKGPELSEEKES